MATKKRAIKSKTPTRKGEPKALFAVWHESDAELIANLRKPLNVDGMLKASIRKRVIWAPDQVVNLFEERMLAIRTSILPRLILLDMRARSGGRSVSFRAYIVRCRSEGVELV